MSYYNYPGHGHLQFGGAGMYPGFYPPGNPGVPAGAVPGSRGGPSAGAPSVDAASQPPRRDGNFRSAAYKEQEIAYQEYRKEAARRRDRNAAWVPGGSPNKKNAVPHKHENPRSSGRRMRPKRHALHAHGDGPANDDDAVPSLSFSEVRADEAHAEPASNLGPPIARHTDPRTAHVHHVSLTHKSNAYSLRDTSDDPVHLAHYDREQNAIRQRNAFPSQASVRRQYSSASSVPSYASADRNDPPTPRSDIHTQTSISLADSQAAVTLPPVKEEPESETEEDDGEAPSRDARPRRQKGRHPHSPPKSAATTTTGKKASKPAPKTPAAATRQPSSHAADMPIPTPRYRAPRQPVKLNDDDPTLAQAIETVMTIKANDIRVLRSMRSPPAGIVYVMEAVCGVLGIVPVVSEQDWGATKTHDYWAISRKEMTNAGAFLKRIIGIDVSKLSADSLDDVAEYIVNPDFVPSKLKKVSVVASKLCYWVRGVYKTATDPLHAEVVTGLDSEPILTLDAASSEPHPASMPDPSGANHIAKLDDSAILRIASLLDPYDLGRFSLTCRRFYNLGQDPFIWEYLFGKTNEKYSRALHEAKPQAIRDRVSRAIAQVKQMSSEEWQTLSRYHSKPDQDVRTVLIALSVVMGRKATWEGARSFLQTVPSLRDRILSFHPRSITRSQVVKLRKIMNRPGLTPADIRDRSTIKDTTLRQAIAKICNYILQLIAYGRVLHKVEIATDQDLHHLERAVQVCAVMGNRENVTRLITPEYTGVSSPGPEPRDLDEQDAVEASPAAAAPSTPGQKSDAGGDDTNDAREDIVFLSRSPATPATPGSDAARADAARQRDAAAASASPASPGVASHVYQDYMTNQHHRGLRAQSAFVPAPYRPTTQPEEAARPRRNSDPEQTAPAADDRPADTARPHTSRAHHPGHHGHPGHSQVMFDPHHHMYGYSSHHQQRARFMPGPHGMYNTGPHASGYRGPIRHGHYGR